MIFFDYRLVSLRRYSRFLSLFISTTMPEAGTTIVSGTRETSLRAPSFVYLRTRQNCWWGHWGLRKSTLIGLDAEKMHCKLRLVQESFVSMLNQHTDKELWNVITGWYAYHKYLGICSLLESHECRLSWAYSALCLKSSAGRLHQRAPGITALSVWFLSCVQTNIITNS